MRIYLMSLLLCTSVAAVAIADEETQRDHAVTLTRQHKDRDERSSVELKPGHYLALPWTLLVTVPRGLDKRSLLKQPEREQYAIRQQSPELRFLPRSR